jgi:2'-5' RNA ligase
MQPSALVVEVPDAEPLVREWRERYDPSASKGMPAHITVLYPFASEVSDAEASEIRAVAAGFAPIRFSCQSLDEFPTVVWLRPTPDTEFRALTFALRSAFPDYQPYRGQFPDPQPHLTVGQTDTADERAVLRKQLDQAIPPHLPISTIAMSLSLFEREAHGPWHRSRQFPFLG